MIRFIIVAAVAALLMGCAAGRGPAGEVIVGFDVAQLPETAQESVNAAAKFLPPPFDALAIGASALLFGGGAAGVAARRRKAEVDAAWDEAEARARGVQAPPPVPVIAPAEVETA